MCLARLPLTQKSMDSNVELVLCTDSDAHSHSLTRAMHAAPAFDFSIQLRTGGGDLFLLHWRG